jgi:hypothetical protein
MPPELADAHRRTLWGKPVAGRHCMEPCPAGCGAGSPPGCCIMRPGHLTDGRAHCCYHCRHQWGGVAPPPPLDRSTLWHVVYRTPGGDEWPQFMNLKELPVRVGDELRKVPVADVRRIDFADRKKKGTSDVIYLADNTVLTGRIELEQDRFHAIPPQGEVWVFLKDMASLRLPSADLGTYAGKFGTRADLTVTGCTEGVVAGTGPYVLFSCVATAAVHAGLLKVGQTGTVRIEIVESPPTYPGDVRNGVKAGDMEMPWEGGAFRFVTG